MKKLFILLISLIFLTANFCFALNSYDYYGQKTGSYKQNTDKKQEVIRQMAQQLCNMINMDLKLAHSKRIQMV